MEKKLDDFDIDVFIDEITSGKYSLSKNMKSLFEQSLFYYCSGNDPSPIAAFGATFPLYIYVDSFIFMRENYMDASEWLYQKLFELRFILKEKRLLDPIGRLSNCEAKNIQLTLWEDNKQKQFYLLYIQADAIKTCSKLFKDDFNYFIPKCICNHQYELNKENTILDTIEEKVPFIFGYAYGDKYRCISQYQYIGNFGSPEEINLFEKKTSETNV